MNVTQTASLHRKRPVDKEDRMIDRGTFSEMLERHRSFRSADRAIQFIMLGGQRLDPLEINL